MVCTQQQGPHPDRPVRDMDLDQLENQKLKETSKHTKQRQKANSPTRKRKMKGPALSMSRRKVGGTVGKHRWLISVRYDIRTMA